MKKNSTPTRILLGSLAGVALLLGATAAQAEHHDGGHPGGGHPGGSFHGGSFHGGGHAEARHFEGHGGPGWGARPAPWHEHGGWVGRGGWGGEVHRVPVGGFEGWRHGDWHHRCWDGRCGWWWLSGGRWYFYDRPVYPYPLVISPVTFFDPALAVPAPPAPGYYLPPMPPG